MAELSPDLVLAACVENNGPMLLATGWALLALAITVIFLRIVFRHRYGSGLHADDYTMLASMVTFPRPCFNLKQNRINTLIPRQWV